MELPSRANILGINISEVDRKLACQVVTQAALNKTPLTVSALATHGIMTGVSDPVHGQRLNSLDMLMPDGQPVRWALNLLHGSKLTDRAYGPDLMRDVCTELSNYRARVFLFGSTEQTLNALAENLVLLYPGLEIAGCLPSQFRQGTREEFIGILRSIEETSPDVCFVGLGCPRQETFVYEASPLIKCPLIAVGAAFDFLSGNDAEPPELVQRLGLQWIHRLFRSPRRLAHRYLVLGPAFLWLVIRQALRGDGQDLNPVVDPPHSSEYYL